MKITKGGREYTVAETLADIPDGYVVWSIGANSPFLEDGTKCIPFAKPLPEYRIDPYSLYAFPVENYNDWYSIMKASSCGIKTEAAALKVVEDLEFKHSVQPYKFNNEDFWKLRRAQDAVKAWNNIK